jgi:NAD(P)-dependent dehydrogenase (short-subunit alcohol dehydrogenase family)
VTAALEATIDAFGRLDAAFNNAGVEQPVKAAADLTDEEWDRLLAINLRGVFVCMKHQIPLMLRQGVAPSSIRPRERESRDSRAKPPTPPPSTA